MLAKWFDYAIGDTRYVLWNARNPKHAAQVMAKGGANDFPRLNALLHCFAVKVAESFVAPVSTTGIVRTEKE